MPRSRKASDEPLKTRFPDLALPSKTVLLQAGSALWVFKGGFQVSSGTVYWYEISSYGIDLDNSEILK